MVIKILKKELAKSSLLLTQSAQVKLKPNIECLSRLAYVGRDADGIFRHDKNVTFQAAVIEFLNKTTQERQAPSFEHVKAHITFVDEDSGEAQRINAGTWMKEEYNSVSLRAGEWRELIITLSSQTGELFLAVDNEYENDRCFERLHFVPLRNKHYRVDVELVDIDRGDAIEEFKFSLGLERHRPFLTLTLLLSKPLEPKED